MEKTENSMNELSAEDGEMLDTVIEEILDELVALDSLIDDEDTEELATLDGEEGAEETAQRMTVVGVRFKPAGKAYFFDPCGLDLKKGDSVIVETSRGLEYGNISFAPCDVSAENLILPLRPVLRVATEADNAVRDKNVTTESRAAEAFRAGVKRHELDMRLLDVECAFDQSKIIFNFAAATRIDFRELVRDLASEFHTRIELKQVASRDVTKIVGGLGICGRPFCCSSFLSNAIHTTIKMAKIQYTSSLNCDKISGACGRLMCCLKYEYSTYEQEMKVTPKKDAEVMTPLGEGRVVESNLLTGLVKVKLVKPDGTDADDTPVVFLRDDLVLKSEYKGEVLTRTPLPEKRRAATPSLATFEVRSPFSDTLGGEQESLLAQAEKQSKNNKNSEDKKKRDNKQKNKDGGRNGAPKNAPKTEQKGGETPEKTAGEEKLDNYEKYEKFDRPKGGKFDRNGKRGKNQSRPNRPQNNQGGTVAPEGGEGNVTPKPEKKQIKPNNNNNNNNKAPEGAKKENQQNSVQGAPNGEGKEGGGKKFHKPYYRNKGGKGHHGGHGKGNGGHGGENGGNSGN